MLCLWFVYACDPTWNTAHSAGEIFYSARSYTGNADMLKAVWYVQRRNAELSKFFRAAIVRTRGYYEFRNKLAHHLTVYHKPQRRMFLAAGNDPFYRKGEITQRDLIVAIRNFKRLKKIWLDTLPNQLPKPRLTPKEALQRIEMLPAQAHSSELSQKQRNRLRQRQLRLRAK